MKNINRNIERVRHQARQARRQLAMAAKRGNERKANRAARQLSRAEAELARLYQSMPDMPACDWSDMNARDRWAS